jgi:hypothetical protein
VVCKQSYIKTERVAGLAGERGRAGQGDDGEEVKEERGKMSFGRFPAEGPWLVQLSLSNAV